MNFERWFGTLKYLATHNLGLKLLALGSGAITWLLIYEVTNHEQTFTVENIQFITDPEFAELSRSAESLQVTIQGSEDDLYAIDASKIKLECDLRGKIKGSVMSVPLLPKDLSFPGDGVATDITPAEISLQFDEQVQRAYPVQPTTTGLLPDDVEQQGYLVTPDKVTIRGSKKILDGLKGLSTEAIDLTGHAEDFRTLVAVRPPDVGAALELQPERVEVIMQLELLSRETTLSDLPIQLLLRPDSPDVEVTPNTVTLYINSRDSELDETSYRGIRTYVDCVELEPGITYDLPVQVTLPPRFSLITVDPMSVQATIVEPDPEPEPEPVEDEKDEVENKGAVPEKEEIEKEEEDTP